MARPSKRLPRGVCLRRRETAHRDVQVFFEALEKGAGGKKGIERQHKATLNLFP